MTFQSSHIFTLIWLTFTVPSRNHSFFKQLCDGVVVPKPIEKLPLLPTIVIVLNLPSFIALQKDALLPSLRQQNHHNKVCQCYDQ